MAEKIYFILKQIRILPYISPKMIVKEENNYQVWPLTPHGWGDGDWIGVKLHSTDN